MQTQLFTLKQGDKFKVEGFPFTFTVSRAFIDTIGKVEVEIVGVHAPMYLNSLVWVTPYDPASKNVKFWERYLDI